MGAYEIGKMAGYTKLITFDMGGTSTDVSLIDNDLSLTFESSISGYPVKVPMIDIHTVGAGGGSIARLDEAGPLRSSRERRCRSRAHLLRQGRQHHRHRCQSLFGKTDSGAFSRRREHFERWQTAVVF